MMKIYQLNKSVIRLTNNAVSFLNGLTSNTMDKPWNAFVNIHGMIIATFDQLVFNEEEVWIIVEKFCVGEVVQHLERYAKLSGVKIEIKDNFFVYFDCAGDWPLEKGDLFIPQKQGRLIITKKQLSPNVSDEEFTLFRLKNNIPMQGVDYKDDFLLNINEEDFISFTKGCFLGQEPISKVHSRSRPSWRLVVKAEEDCTDEERAKMTSKAVDSQTNQRLGFVFVSNKD